MPYFKRQDSLRFTLTACVVLCSPGPAWCQTSLNLSLLSAYTARGLTMDPQPVAQLRVEHDIATQCDTGCEAGWYLGAFASPVRLDNRRQAQLIAYGGRSQRLGATLTWDVGVTHSRFTRGSRFDYNEFHVGLMRGRSSARLLYSPAYYGEERSLYLDLNHAWPLGEQWILALHAGRLHPFSAKGANGEPERDSTDLRLTLATQVGAWRLQAGWQTAWHPYHLPGTVPARALTAGVSLPF
jgi:uncharacterized protein (TIGR02001 family)